MDIVIKKMEPNEEQQREMLLALVVMAFRHTVGGLANSICAMKL